MLGLPLIRNEKTVDPADPSSPKVIQLESAMGAAIEVFPGATAIAVGRDRFLPVKTTNELLLLRSDVFDLGVDGRLQAQVARIPEVDLDPKHYRLIEDFDRLVSVVPSLRDADALVVRGEWHFDSPVAVTGELRTGRCRGTAALPVTARWQAALGYALTGCELQLAEPGRPDPQALVEGLDAAGWPASRVAEHAARAGRRRSCLAPRTCRPPFAPAVVPPSSPQRSRRPGSCCSLTTLEVRAPSGRLKLNPDEERLMREVPPHHGS